MKRKGRHHGVSGGVKAAFVMDRELASADKPQAQLNTLVQRFEEVVVFDEFIDAGESGFEEAG